MEYVFAVILLLILVGAVIARPLAEGANAEVVGRVRIAELEAAKEAKYREIRDAELDYGMGKMSDADYATVDSELRAEAIEILRELDELRDLAPERERDARASRER